VLVVDVEMFVEVEVEFVVKVVVGPNVVDKPFTVAVS
jgi:hypothetical protein